MKQQDTVLLNECIYKLYDWSGFMELFPKQNLQHNKNQQDSNILHMLDRGIDDMEVGHELSLEDAFYKITQLRVARRNARS